MTVLPLCRWPVWMCRAPGTGHAHTMHNCCRGQVLGIAETRLRVLPNFSSSAGRVACPTRLIQEGSVACCLALPFWWVSCQAQRAQAQCYIQISD